MYSLVVYSIYTYQVFRSKKENEEEKMLEKKALAVDKTVPTIQALILLDNEGKRIAVDYFSEKLYV